MSSLQSDRESPFVSGKNRITIRKKKKKRHWLENKTESLASADVITVALTRFLTLDCETMVQTEVSLTSFFPSIMKQNLTFVQQRISITVVSFLTFNT